MAFQHQVRQYDPKYMMEIVGQLHVLGNLPVPLICGTNDEWEVIDQAHRPNKAILGSEPTRRVWTILPGEST